MRTAFIALLLALGCAEPGLVVTKNPEGVIVPASQASRYSGGRGHSQFFTPTVEDVAKLEAALPGFLGKEAGKSLAARAPSYGRQYVGLLVAGKHRIVVGAYCNVHREKLKAPFIIFDGGDCVFGVDYELETGTFLNFGTNGLG